MSALKKIELEVEASTADALTDVHRRAAIARMVDRMVRPGPNDPLLVLLEQTAQQAREAGFTDKDLEAELAAYNAERRG